MNAMLSSNVRPLDAMVAGAVDRFGLFPVLRAVLRQVLRRRSGPALVNLDHLSNHLRRDIGLPPHHHGRKHRLDRPLPWLM